MKKIILLTCLFAIISNSYGQDQRKLSVNGHFNKHRVTPQTMHREFIKHLLGNKKTKSLARSTSEIAERLIAQSDYTHTVFLSDTVLIDTLVENDSAKYGYSSNRTSYFNYFLMDYNNNYTIDGSTIFDFASNIGILAHNDEPDMLSDTSELFQIIPLIDTFGLIETRYANYDTNNNIITYADVYPDSGFYSNNKYINNYDTINNIINSLSFNQNISFTYDTSEDRIFMYDSYNRLIKDSTNDWSTGVCLPFEKWVYSYDAYSNMIEADYYSFDGLTWTEPERYIMTYNIDSSLHTLEIDADSSYGWVPMYYDSLGYISGINYATFYQENAYTDSGYLNTRTIYTKHVTMGGFPDTLYTSQYDMYGNYLFKYFTYYSYDSYHEPIVAMSYNFIFDSTMITGNYDTTYNEISNYYYELYESRHAHNNSVPNIPITNANVKVFPNPAGNTLNISCPGIAAGAYTYVSLTNAAGQTLRTEALPWLSETESISMQGLIPGIYWLSLRDAKGNTFYRQAVVKQ